MGKGEEGRSEGKQTEVWKPAEQGPGRPPPPERCPLGPSGRRQIHAHSHVFPCTHTVSQRPGLPRAPQRPWQQGDRDDISEGFQLSGLYLRPRQSP